MKNLSKLSLLIVFLSIFIYTPVFAVTPTNQAASANGVILATVNIVNTKIVSQKGNIFNISFSLSNREGLQTGVKYGVKLVQESKTNQIIIDERVYDESLTLNPNTTTKKEIVYTAPASLSGSYTLMLTSNNSSGFPFGIASLGKVTLTATSVGIQILPETCKLQTSDINQRIDVNLGESIKLTCTALNSSKVDITVIPSYEVHLGTSFGDVITQSGGSVDPIAFKAGEKKSFSVSLPKATTPQIYNVNFTLNDKDIKSNSIDVDYMVLGTSATISNVSLDKDYYNKGDKALLSFVYRTNATSTITSKIQISDGKGKSCADTLSLPLTIPIPPKVDTSIAITSSCINPVVSVTLTDDKGVVLAQKEFNVKTTSVPARTSSSAIIYIILAILIIVALYVYFKKKKNTPPASVPMGVLFFFLLIASFGMIPTHKVSADTYGYNGGFLILQIGPRSGTAGDPYTTNIGQITAYIDAQCSYYCPFLYNTKFGAKTNTSVGGIAKSESGIFNLLLGNIAEAVVQNPALGSGYTQLFSVGATGATSAGGSASFWVPSAPGTYTMEFSDNNGSFYATIPYVVVNPPVLLPPTVTVYANGANPLTVGSGTDVQITWDVGNLAPTDQCFCTYAGTKGDCGSSTGSGRNKIGSTIKLSGTTTIDVTCTN